MLCLINLTDRLGGNPVRVSVYTYDTVFTVPTITKMPSIDLSALVFCLFSISVSGPQPKL